MKKKTTAPAIPATIYTPEERRERQPISFYAGEVDAGRLTFDGIPEEYRAPVRHVMQRKFHTLACSVLEHGDREGRARAIAAISIDCIRAEVEIAARSLWERRRAAAKQGEAT